MFIDDNIENQSNDSRIRVAYLPISQVLLGLYGSKHPKENRGGASQNESSPDL